MAYTVNGHTVSTFYAGFVNYVVDGAVFYSVSDAAKACGMETDDFKDYLYSHKF